MPTGALPPPGRAARFAAVLGVLRAAHTVADHVVQTDAQALGKASATGWAAPMAGHVGSYHAVQVAVLAVASRGLGLRLSPWRAVAAVAWSASTHAFLDRRWPVQRLLELTGSEDFATPLTTVRLDVDGLGRVAVPAGVPTQVDAIGPVPLHGPYLADQALHDVCLAVAAWIATGGTE